MQLSPTASQLCIAIEVLGQLGERLEIEAAHSITKLPDTQLGVHYAGDIGSQTMEQTGRIEAVAAQLKNWRQELLAQESWQIHQARKSAVGWEKHPGEKESKPQKSWDEAGDLFLRARGWLGHILQHKRGA